MSETGGLTVQDLLNVLEDSFAMTMSSSDILDGFQEGWRQGQLRGHRLRLELGTMLRAVIELDPRFDQMTLSNIRVMDPTHVIGSDTMTQPFPDMEAP